MIDATFTTPYLTNLKWPQPTPLPRPPTNVHATKILRPRLRPKPLICASRRTFTVRRASGVRTSGKIRQRQCVWCARAMRTAARATPHVARARMRCASSPRRATHAYAHAALECARRSQTRISGARARTLQSPTQCAAASLLECWRSSCNMSRQSGCARRATARVRRVATASTSHGDGS